MGTDLDLTTAPEWATTCLNCRHELHGAFCAHCGQRALPPHPTVSELTTDAWQELVGWDGKVIRTLRALLVHPGQATREMLDGQRARYIPPFRLYLLCSVIYFIVAAGSVPPDVAEMRFEIGVGVGAQSSTQTVEEAALLKAMAYRLETLPPEEQAAARQAIANQPRVFQPFMRALATDYADFRRRVTEAMPRVLFLLIPALAGLLALFYPGRRYAGHLYFALHFQTIVFLALAVSALTAYGAPLLAQSLAQLAAIAAILVYAILAQRHVYGGAWARTILKAVGVGVLYSALWSSASLGIALWVTRGN